jgi:hypothetical protein
MSLTRFLVTATISFAAVIGFGCLWWQVGPAFGASMLDFAAFWLVFAAVGVATFFSVHRLWDRFGPQAAPERRTAGDAGDWLRPSNTRS